MSLPFLVEALHPGHERAAFSSGVEPLDRYFREQVSQDVQRRATVCYVAIDRAHGKVAGYYTLAAGGIPLTELPADPPEARIDSGAWPGQVQLVRGIEMVGGALSERFPAAPGGHLNQLPDDPEVG